MTNENDWFAPKRFGYGASLPIAWQGWAVLLGYLAATVIAAVLCLPTHIGLLLALVAILTLPLIVVSARHTRGGWKWRWGDDT